VIGGRDFSLRRSFHGKGFAFSFEGNEFNADGPEGRFFERTRDNAATILSLRSYLRQFLFFEGEVPSGLGPALKCSR
jgi:hypothetical protein